MDTSTAPQALTFPTVGDVMSRRPLTVPPTAGFREAVRLLTSEGVDALPVVDEGRLVGLVGADDLLLKEEMVELPHGGTGTPWQRHRDRTRARGRQVGEVMDAHPPTVQPGESLGRAARELHRRHRGCLLVVDDDGALLGIVTRTDLLSVYLRDDAEIRQDVEALALGSVDDARITVQDGCVRLEGRAAYRSQADRLTEVAGHVPGVVAVDCRLAVDVDDLHLALLGC